MAILEESVTQSRNPSGQSVPTGAGADDLSWRQLIYKEAWRQYEHENTLCQSRNTIFLTLQMALMGAPLATTAALLQADDLPASIVLLVLGLATFLLTYLGRRICHYWRCVTVGGQGYLVNRLNVIEMIEIDSGLQTHALASAQRRWRTYFERLQPPECRSNWPRRWRLFGPRVEKKKPPIHIPHTEDPRLLHLMNLPYQWEDGWATTVNTIELLKRYWIYLRLVALAVFVVGFYLFIDGHFGWHLPF